MTDINMEERIEELLNKCRFLEEQIQELQQDASTNSEKNYLLDNQLQCANWRAQS